MGNQPCFQGVRKPAIQQVAARSSSLLFWKPGCVDNLDWLNLVVVQLWPHANNAMKKMAADTIEPMIRSYVPGISISDFDLGTQPPVLGPIVATTTTKGPTLEVMAEFQSTCDIALHLGVPFGIRGLKFSGKLNISMEQVFDEVPVVGGLTFYFVDQPKIEYDLTGLANMGDMPGVRGALRSAIEKVVSSFVVLPNQFLLPLAYPNQPVDFAAMTLPAPIFVLRLTVVRGNNLIAADLGGKSDPYAVVRVADQSFRTSTVSGDLNPEFSAADRYDFVVYDPRQRVLVSMYDHDTFTTDDELGSIVPISVEEAIQMSNKPIDLFNNSPVVAGSTQSATKQGSVTLRCRRLRLMHGSQTGEVLFLVARIGTVVLPPGVMDSVVVKFTLGDVKVTTPCGTPVVGTGAAVHAVLRDVVTKMGKKNISPSDISEVTGLSAKAVSDVLAGRPLDERVLNERKVLTADINSTMYIRMPESFQAKQKLQVCICTYGGTELGSTTCDVGSAGGSELSFSGSKGALSADITFSWCGTKTE